MGLNEIILYLKPHMEKAFEASKMPILFLVVLAVLDLVGSVLTGLDAFIILAIVLALAIFLWAGYNAVNRFKLNQDDALRTGVITGFIAGLIIMLIRFIVIDLGWVKGASIHGDILPYILDILLITVFMAFWGGIIAGIGGYISLRGKPQEKPAKNKPVESVPRIIQHLKSIRGMKFFGVILLIFGIYFAVMGVLMQSILGVSIGGIQMAIFGLGLFVLGLVIIRSESNQKKKAETSPGRVKAVSKDNEFKFVIAGFIIGMFSAMLWVVSAGGSCSPYNGVPQNLALPVLAVEWILPALPVYLKLKNSKRRGFLIGQICAFVISILVLLSCWGVG